METEGLFYPFLPYYFLLKDCSYPNWGNLMLTCISPMGLVFISGKERVKDDVVSRSEPACGKGGIYIEGTNKQTKDLSWSIPQSITLFSCIY